MNLRRPPWRLALGILAILLLVINFSILNAEDAPVDDDLEEIEELIALDEEEGRGDEWDAHAKLSDAEVLTKAQRIVLELNSDSTRRVIEQNEFVLLLGYAPWCARSAELMPQFAEAATLLKEMRSPVVLAKLDAERYPRAASDVEIKGFPTLLLFVNGTRKAYSGGFSAEEIVIWVRKKTGAPVIRVNSAAEAEELLKKYHMFVVGLLEKFQGSDYEEFVKAATANNDIQFIEVNDLHSARVLYPDIQSSKSFLGIVKNEPEKYTSYEGDFSEDKILQFLDLNKFPLVTHLTEANSIKVYSSPMKLQVMVFAEEDELKKLVEPLQNVARKFKPEIMFITVNMADENLAKPFLTLYGIENSDDTVVAAFDNKISSKYLLEADPTPAKIEEFAAKLLQGVIPPFFKSQPVPDNTDALIQVVVGKTLDDLVLKSPKNVLLEVHTPWCTTCESTSKKVEKLAKHFKGNDNLVFARIDASVNEHPKLQVNDYPTLLLYSTTDKHNPTKVSAKLGLKDMANLINKHTRVKKDAEKDEL
ncbi:hypothetical protein MLD38_029448 [Melastoma candidum]|uniref:Uncharacterized protein n=2 Tax=Melastoma candidum TaxID=119954 RepID=A0ACB9N403_9MYRT|nr:hypothetical protein MLD38_029448 [Melastoma candidum]